MLAKVCACPGCPACVSGCANLVDRGRCATCTPARRSQASHDRKKLYNSRRWKGLRRAKLRATPWCEEPGCHALATDVDHDIAIEDGGPEYPPLDELNSLCKPHHSAKTMREIRARQ